MHQLIIKKYTFLLPSNVNELTGSQHRWLNQQRIDGHKLTPWAVFFRMIRHPKNAYLKRFWLAWWILYNQYLIPLLDRWTRGVFTFRQSVIPLEDWYDLVHWCTDFMQTDQSPFFTPPVRRIWGVFSSPGDGCRYLSFGEFLEADQALAAYDESSAEQDLNLLIAYLYLPVFSRFWPWLQRMLGREEAVLWRADLLGRLPRALRLSILQYFAGSRKAMAQLYPHVFPASESDQTPKRTNIRQDYQDWFNHISGSPLHNAEAYLIPVWEVISSMESKILEAQRIEAELKKNPRT